MAERVILDPGEQDLMRNVAQFAARKAMNGVYIGTFHSGSVVNRGVGAKVLVVVAFGEQADALNHILMSAAVPDETAIANTSGGKDFLDGGDVSDFTNNGNRRS